MCRMVNRKRAHVCGGRYEYRRLGYGAVFFGVHGLVFAWAEMKRVFFGLGLFALGIAAAYGFFALLERQLRMGVERDFYERNSMRWSGRESLTAAERSTVSWNW